MPGYRDTTAFFRTDFVQMDPQLIGNKCAQPPPAAPFVVVVSHSCPYAGTTIVGQPTPIPDPLEMAHGSLYQGELRCGEARLETDGADAAPAAHCCRRGNGPRVCASLYGPSWDIQNVIVNLGANLAAGGLGALCRPSRCERQRSISETLANHDIRQMIKNRLGRRGIGLAPGLLRGTPNLQAAFDCHFWSIRQFRKVECAR